MTKQYNIPYISISNGRVVYRPRITKKFQGVLIDQDKNGFLRPPIKLGVVGTLPIKLWEPI